MARFILETDDPSGQIIRLSINTRRTIQTNYPNILHVSIAGTSGKNQILKISTVIKSDTQLQIWGL